MSSVMEIAMKDIGYLIELANANLKNLPGPVYNVKGYKAVGDGLTDDTAAITATINAAVSAGGGVIFFPPGTYKANIVMASMSNLILQGCGKASKIVALGVGYNCLTMTLCNYVTVQDLYLYASGNDSLDISEDNGLFITQCNYVTVKNSLFENHGFAGVCCFNSSHITIEQNLFKDGVGTLSTDSADIFVAGTLLYEDYQILNNKCISTLNGSGIVFTGYTSNVEYRDILIDGNNCDGHARIGICVYLTLTLGTDLTFTNVRTVNNSCRSNGRNGIYYQSVDDSIIAHNHVEGNLNGGGSVGIEGGIYINACLSVVVEANTIKKEIGPGIKVQGHSAFSDRRRCNVSLIGNVISDGQTIGKSSVLIGEYANLVHIVDNTISGGKAQAVELNEAGLGNCLDISIEGNQISDVESYAIYSTGGEGTIKNNRILSSKYAPIFLKGAVWDVDSNEMIDCNKSASTGGDGAGIHLSGVTRWKATNNRVRNRTATGKIYDGLLISGAASIWALAAHNDFSSVLNIQINPLAAPTTFIRSRNTDGTNSPL